MLDSMKCPSCGSPEIIKENSLEYKCKNCGTYSKLSKDQEYLILINGYPCPSCGIRNESETKYCGNCGTKLLKICPSCNKEVLLDKKFCPNCGQNLYIICPFCNKENSSDSKKCSTCGREIYKPCISCNQLFPSNLSICPYCGFDTDSNADFVMKVDGVFFIDNFGDVIAGKILRGSINVGDELFFFQKGLRKITRVKSIEQYSRSIKIANSGMIVGIKIDHEEMKEINKGAFLYK